MSKIFLPTALSRVMCRNSFVVRCLVLMVAVNVVAEGGIRPVFAQQDLIDVLDKSDDKRVALYMAVGRVKFDQIARAAVDVFATCMVRVRLTKIEPDTDPVMVQYRTGGEGLGGTSIQGTLLGVGKTPPPWKGAFRKEDIGLYTLVANEWSAPVSLKTLMGSQPPTDLRFVTFGAQTMLAQGNRVYLGQPKAMKYEFEFSTDDGQVFKSFVEDAPSGSTVSLAIAGAPMLVGIVRQGFLKDPKALSPRFDPKLYPEFIAELQGLSGYVHARHERLLKKYSPSDPLPKKIGVMGRLAGFGAYGYGVRHSNPAIVEEEAQVLRLLGMNGINPGASAYDSTYSVIDRKEFPRLTMGAATGVDPRLIASSGSPFHPSVRKAMLDQAEATIADRKVTTVEEYWSICVDEIGVALKEGIDTIPDCITEYRKYLAANGVQPADLGVASLEDVKPYTLWTKGEKGALNLAPKPEAVTDRLNFYYTYRFMTYITAQLFAEGAEKLDKAGIKLYAMMAPTPTWGGASLDWHEFYDLKANRLLVFETSNRDPRVWQWESYLGDIMRGIGERHAWPLGALIKPHRGAPKQRMLTLLARGMRGFEWYTYGPDYAKGDSWSQTPYLLDAVAEAGRFAGKAEEYVYEAKWAKKPDVAFVLPHSSEVWFATGQTDSGMDNARWVYTALNHEHIPVDILSEQQLIEGKAAEYKMLYVVGSNLHHAALGKVEEWVRKGGVLWTDCNGLRFDEAYEPSAAANELLGLTGRTLERWGQIPGYGSTTLAPVVNTSPIPESAAIKWEQEQAGDAASGDITACAAREVLQPKETKNNQILARFADGKPAIVRHQYGLGATYIVGTYAGGAYSAKIRRADYDMGKDYDPAVRSLITRPALELKVYRPVVPKFPTIEAVLLEKNGKRSIALINWTYGPAGPIYPEQLRIALPDVGEFKTVRSLQQGPLKVEGAGKNRSVILPKINDIDLLILEN